MYPILKVATGPVGYFCNIIINLVFSQANIYYVCLLAYSLIIQRQKLKSQTYLMLYTTQFLNTWLKCINVVSFYLNSLFPAENKYLMLEIFLKLWKKLSFLFLYFIISSYSFDRAFINHISKSLRLILKVFIPENNLPPPAWHNAMYWVLSIFGEHSHNKLVLSSVDLWNDYGIKQNRKFKYV